MGDTKEESRIEEVDAKWIENTPDIPDGCKLEVLRVDGVDYLQVVKCPDLTDVMRVLGEILDRVKSLEDRIVQAYKHSVVAVNIEGAISDADIARIEKAMRTLDDTKEEDEQLRKEIEKYQSPDRIE